MYLCSAFPFSNCYELASEMTERLALQWSIRFANKRKRGLGSPFFQNSGNRSKLRRRSLMPIKFTIWCA